MGPRLRRQCTRYVSLLYFSCRLHTRALPCLLHLSPFYKRGFVANLLIQQLFIYQVNKSCVLSITRQFISAHDVHLLTASRRLVAKHQDSQGSCRTAEFRSTVRRSCRISGRSDSKRGPPNIQLLPEKLRYEAELPEE